MNRRDCFALPLILAGCGGSDMEYEIQPSPSLRTSKSIFPGVSVGVWTPVLTFNTPGDLSVSYNAAERKGYVFRFGELIFVFFQITTTAFTHTTASGQLQITGLPFTPSGSRGLSNGNCSWRGITKAGYTDITPLINPDDPFFVLIASGSGQVVSQVVAADMPSGGTVELSGGLIYQSISNV